MPLTADQQNRLFEIYQVPVTLDTTVIGGASGLFQTPVVSLAGLGQASVKGQLEKALVSINASAAQSERVAAILAEYDGFALDPSNIDKNGYSFRADKARKAILNALYVYTGIVPNFGVPNRTPLG